MSRAIATGSALVGLPMLLVFIGHLKSLPFAYTIRSWFLLKRMIRVATAKGLEPEPLFTVISQEYRCLLDDMDYNQHMNNSMYNKTLDFARIETLYRLSPKIMLGKAQDVFVHNAGVLTLFRKEILPFQKYTLESRMLTWNEKWLWLQHRFVYKDSKSGQQVLACLAVSKIVFKYTSGKTISPGEALQISGHDVDAYEDRRRNNWELVQGILKVDTLMHNAWWEGNIQKPPTQAKL